MIFFIYLSICLLAINCVIMYPSAAYSLTNSLVNTTLVNGSEPSFAVCGFTDLKGIPNIFGLDPVASVEKVLFDNDHNSYMLGRAVVVISFNDNNSTGILDSLGTGIIVHEVGDAEPFKISIIDSQGQYIRQHTIMPSPTEESNLCNQQINVAYLDFSELGLESPIQSIELDNLGRPGWRTGSDLSSFEFVNSTSDRRVEETMRGNSSSIMDLLFPNRM